MPKPIEIQFDTPFRTEHQTRVVIEPHNPITKCTIYGQYKPISRVCWDAKAFGIIHCRPGDVYDYETGNRLALTSALRGIIDTRLRKAIWDEYFKLFPVAERKPVPEPDRRGSLIDFIKLLESLAEGCPTKDNGFLPRPFPTKVFTQQGDRR